MSSTCDDGPTLSLRELLADPDLFLIGLADVEHAREPGIAVATLVSPGSTAMGTDDDRVDVRAVFMMAITDMDAQVTVLGQLVEALQDDELLRRLVDAPDAGGARELLDGWTAHRMASG